VQEKIMMTPGDVSMLLTIERPARPDDITRLAATVRIRAFAALTQILPTACRDGGQTGSTACCRSRRCTPQVEVIKGLGSA
jgi:hypothetical protein